MRLLIILSLLITQSAVAWELNPWAPKPQKRFVDTKKAPSEMTTAEIDAMCDEIRDRLDAKFKDDKDTHPEMWDKNWINKPL